MPQQDEQQAADGKEGRRGDGEGVGRAEQVAETAALQGGTFEGKTETETAAGGATTERNDSMGRAKSVFSATATAGVVGVRGVSAAFDASEAPPPASTGPVDPAASTSHPARRRFQTMVAAPRVHGLFHNAIAHESTREARSRACEEVFRTALATADQNGRLTRNELVTFVDSQRSDSSTSTSSSSSSSCTHGRAGRKNLPCVSSEAC